MRSAYILLELRQIGGALATGCHFPQSNTRLHNENWPEEGGALQTGDAPITERIRYERLPVL